MNGLTQTTESGEASLAPAEENRWIVELPLTRVDDFREDRSKGWALGVQVDADNVSSFAIKKAWIVPPSGPVALATEHAWTKTGQADPVLRAPADGPVMSVRVGIELLLHIPSGDLPTGLGVQLLLIEEDDDAEGTGREEEGEVRCGPVEPGEAPTAEAESRGSAGGPERPAAPDGDR